MIRYAFKKVNREQLAKIAVNAIFALADKRKFDTFIFTLDVDGDHCGDDGQLSSRTIEICLEDDLWIMLSCLKRETGIFW